MKFLHSAKLGITLALSGTVFSAYGEHGNDYSAYAKVVNVEPQYSTVQVARPTESCWDEPTYQVPHKSYTSAILGGIVGGVLGNQVGKGTGKDVATVAGTVLGASVGNDVSNHNASAGYSGSERHCETRNQYSDERQLNGYRVTYEYNGRTYETQMDRHPGKEIPVNVSVTPAY